MEKLTWFDLEAWGEQELIEKILELQGEVEILQDEVKILRKS